MNISRTLPLIVLLLLSLSVISFAWLALPAQYVKLTPIPLSNQISVYIFVNQSGGGKIYPHYPPYDTYHIQGFGARNASVVLSMNSSDFVFTCYGGVNSIDYCYTNFIIDTSKVNVPVNMSGANYFSCSSPTTNVPLSNATTDCAQFFGSTYTSMYPADWNMWVVNQTGSVFASLWSNLVSPTMVCMANVVDDGSGYFYFNLYHPDCGGCSPELSFACNSSSGDKMMCLNHQYTLQTSCANGGWSYCNLTSASACPAGPIPTINVSFAPCQNATSCNSNEECVCGYSLHGDNQWYKDVSSTTCKLTTGFPTDFNGTCMLKDGQTCTAGSQCSSEICLDQGTNGAGTCAYWCQNDASCPASYYSCVSPTSPAGSMLLNRGINEAKYCLEALGTMCSNNDICYSQNCKPGCSPGDTTLRCIVPSYSCACTSDSDCPVGNTCNAVPYSGPVRFYSLGQMVCTQGLSNGQTCTQSNDCGSRNCQNSVCCAVGRVCCSSDSQCSAGQVCFTNSNWGNTQYTNWYDSCGAKLSNGVFCYENKECYSGQCVNNFCFGSNIATTYTYTTSPIDYTSLLQYSILNITLNYNLATGGSVPETTICTLYWNSHVVQVGSCTSIFQVNLTNVGLNNFYIAASKVGYDTAFGHTIQVNVYNAGSLYGNGYQCSSGSDCLSGRCELVTNGQQQSTGYIDCTSNSQCADNYCQGLDVPLLQSGCNVFGSPSDTVCQQSYGASYYCDTSTMLCTKKGRCAISQNNYKICCANDGNLCCNPYDYTYTDFQKCSPGSQPPYTRACNYITATCSIRSSGLGQECNISTVNSCSQGTCLPTYLTNKSICCLTTNQQSYCCQSNADCPVSYTCNSQSFVCSLEIHYGIYQLCNSHSDCDVIGGYGCTPAHGLQSYGISDGAKVCQPFTCNNGEIPCAYCLGNSSLSPEQCLNSTRSIVCASSSTACITYYNGQTTPNTGGVTGAVTVEDLFNQLLTLLYWVMAVVIFFFIVALFISGLHLAYGLVKR
jgi:hypothetical protein